jgi:type VI protein secretion system component VasK
VWRAAKYINTWAVTTVEAVIDREGKYANTATEKEDMLEWESFLQNDTDQYYKLPLAGIVHKR